MIFNITNVFDKDNTPTLEVLKMLYSRLMWVIVFSVVQWIVVILVIFWGEGIIPLN